MRRLSATDVHAQKVAELGLDPSAFDLAAVEAIAGALRRAASFLCPCTRPTLVRDVVRPLRGLVPDLEKINALVEDTLEDMIAHGDILEHRDVDGDLEHGTAELLYAAPASFVARQSGAAILLGISSDQLSALPDDLEARIEYVNHLRRLTPQPGEDVGADLRQLGLIDLPYRDWLRAPTLEAPAGHVSRLDHLLDSVPPSRDVPGLSLLDPARPVRYYRGRWTAPRSHSGRFVARRDQAYGSQLWCYVQLREGNPERLVDLPLAGSRWRGCDEAWRLQLAIDAQRGDPQQLRTRTGPVGTRIIEIFSPIPMWARRRWNAIGEPVSVSGCMFAYRLPAAELAEELRFAREALWLEDATESMRQP